MEENKYSEYYNDEKGLVIEKISELRNSILNYNYYMNEFYDIYIINMGKPVGIYYGIETNYIAIKCEQNTNTIHVIEPTLRRLNINTKNTYSRKKTDLSN